MDDKIDINHYIDIVLDNYKLSLDIYFKRIHLVGIAIQLALIATLGTLLKDELYPVVFIISLLGLAQGYFWIALITRHRQYLESKMNYIRWLEITFKKDYLIPENGGFFTMDARVFHGDYNGDRQYYKEGGDNFKYPYEKGIHNSKLIGLGGTSLEGLLPYSFLLAWLFILFYLKDKIIESPCGNWMFLFVCVANMIIVLLSICNDVYLGKSDCFICIRGLFNKSFYILFILYFIIYFIAKN